MAADARRMPEMVGFVRGERIALQERQQGTLATVQDVPEIDAANTSTYIRDVLDGRQAVPAALAAQVEHILRLVARS